MKVPYKSKNPNAGVKNYEMTDTGIILEFADGKWRYAYDDVVPGAKHVAAMKRLAMRGTGLSTYINQHVRERYASKTPLTPIPTPEKLDT